MKSPAGESLEWVSQRAPPCQDVGQVRNRPGAWQSGGAKIRRRAVAQMLDTIGRGIARYLEKPVPGYEPFTPSDPSALRQSLEPGDILLVKGNSRISRLIKYLTQCTWS